MKKKNISVSNSDTKRFLRETTGTIPGCCDPKQPFKPISPNRCDTCQKHADVTCHNFVTGKGGSNAKNK